MHELLRALRRTAEAREVTPGAPWTLEAPTRGEGALTVSDPLGRPVESQVIASGRATRLALPAASLPGLYLVKQGQAVVGAAAVNTDPRESDTRPIALEKLKSGQGAAVAIALDEEDLLAAGKTRPLWPELAAAVAVLLGVEMLLLAAWRRDRPKRQGAG